MARAREIRARAPATLMLFGEHSVLRFGEALVAAVNAFLTVEVEARTDDKIQVISTLGDEITSRFDINLSDKFRFLNQVLISLQSIITSGFTCRITSDFPSNVGLGSSAAVTIAALGAIEQFFGFNESQKDLHKRALDVVRKVQGRGSGADLAASLLGGIVSYQAEPRVSMKRIADALDLTICFSGYKTTTPEVIRQVEERSKKFPDLMDGLMRVQALIASQAKDLINLHILSEASQGVMEGFGVSDKTLSELVLCLKNAPGIQGAKISGSGLGDCVIGFGRLTCEITLPRGCTILPYTVTKTGLTVES